MSEDITKATSNILMGAEWQDSIEACVRTEICRFIEEILEVELLKALGRRRYERASAPKRLLGGVSESDTEAATEPWVIGHRNGHRVRQPIGTFVRLRCRFPCTPGERRRRNERMEEQDAFHVPPPHERGGCVDRRQLSGRHEHASRRARAGGAVCRLSFERHGEPGVAEDQEGLGGVEQTRSSLGRHGSLDPGRNPCSGAAALHPLFCNAAARRLA
jgi:hypothetical protein